MLFDCFSVFCAIVSAGLWLRSSTVRPPFGLHMEKELVAALNKIGRLNSWAALSMALAIILQAAKFL